MKIAIIAKMGERSKFCYKRSTNRNFTGVLLKKNKIMLLTNAVHISSFTWDTFQSGHLNGFCFFFVFFCFLFFLFFFLFCGVAIKPYTWSLKAYPTPIFGDTAEIFDLKWWTLSNLNAHSQFHLHFYEAEI